MLILARIGRSDPSDVVIFLTRINYIYAHLITQFNNNNIDTLKENINDSPDNINENICNFSKYSSVITFFIINPFYLIAH